MQSLTYSQGFKLKKISIVIATEKFFVVVIAVSSPGAYCYAARLGLYAPGVPGFLV